MSKTVEIGVFIPTVSRAWFHSTNTPYLPGTFDHALHVTRGAELYGYDFVLSPQNWRGTKGPSKYWRHSLNSLGVTGALLQATSRIKVWGTGNVTLIPPAMAADMVATFDQIGPGRVGLNIVTGGQKSQFDTLGMWNDEFDHDEKYDYADEWVNVVKALWADDVVDFQGKYFNLYDAMMDPKPSTRPTLVNAGASSRGFRFAVENCDVAFMVCGDNPEFLASARESKRVARDLGNSDFKTYGLMTIVPGETDKEALSLMQWIESGVDLEGLSDLHEGYKANTKGYKKLSSSSLATLGGDTYRSVLPGVITGAYDTTLVERIAKTIIEGELDGVMLIVPDYLDHLQKLALRTLPKLADFGIATNVGVGGMKGAITPSNV